MTEDDFAGRLATAQNGDPPFVEHGDRVLLFRA